MHIDCRRRLILVPGDKVREFFRAAGADKFGLQGVPEAVEDFLFVINPDAGQVGPQEPSVNPVLWLPVREQQGLTCGP